MKLPNKDDPDLLLKLRTHFARHEATFDNLNRILAEHEKRQGRNARRRRRGKS